MSYEHILYALEDGVARISLNDPKTMNGVNEAMGFVPVERSGEIQKRLS